MNPSELFKLAGHCLALDAHPEFQVELREKISSGETDIDDLIFLCSNHLVLPALYLIFRKHNLLDLFPGEYAEHLKGIYEQNRVRNAQILKQIEEISAELNKESICPVFLKGTGNLLDGLYSDIGERMIGDIDFLVAEKDFHRTAEVLLKMGYFDQAVLDGDEIFSPKHHHYPGLTQKDKPAVVEIHRSPVAVKYTRHFSGELVVNEQKKIAGKENMYVPSDRHKLILNFIHGQLSDGNHNKWSSSLRDLFDGYLLSKRVNSKEIYAGVEEKLKAQAFDFLICRTFGVQDKRLTSPEPKVMRYIQRFDWWMNHPGVYSLGFRIIDFFVLIFDGYIGKIFKAIYRKSYRKYIWIRIKNPQWIKAHFKLVWNKFWK